MYNMSQELPSPPPLKVERIADGNEDGSLDFGNMGWRFCRQPIQKVKRSSSGCPRCERLTYTLNFSYPLR
jgi:hypothetical protein